MKKYVMPEINETVISFDDVILSSVGTPEGWDTPDATVGIGGIL